MKFLPELYPQAIFSGVLQGGVYALLALGLALVFGTLKVVNLAHGELVLLGAFIAYFVESRLGLDPMFALPLAVLIVCAAMALVGRMVARLGPDRELNSLLLTYGVGVALGGGMLSVWSADVRLARADWLHEPIVVGDLVACSYGELLAFIAGLAAFAGLWVWLNKSWPGRALRAVSNDREAAMLMGIDPAAAERTAFIVAGILASLAGVMLFGLRPIYPALGEALTIKAFVIVVLAGSGSMATVLAAAVFIGVVESLAATQFGSSVPELVSMGLFLLVLFCMPNGLSGFLRGTRCTKARS